MQTNIKEEALNFDRHVKFLNMLLALRYDLSKYTELKEKGII